MSKTSMLLLGGNGFLGSAIAKRLADLRCTVHIVSRNEAEFTHPLIHYHKGTLDDVSLLTKLLPQCETIIHLASTCTPSSSESKPSKEGEENLLPLLRFLETLSAHSPRQLIFISSGGTVYGNPVQLPVTEDAPFVPLSYHGAGKAAAELFLQGFANSGWPVTVLRPSNIYGPGQTIRPGFGVIRTLLEHLKTGTAMQLWGDGTTLRDYLYIEDFVDAILGITHHHVTGTFNVGSGMGFSLQALIDLAETTTGRSLDIDKKPARAIDVKGVVLDYQKLNRAVGWRPSVDLATGLYKTWEWVLQQS